MPVRHTIPLGIVIFLVFSVWFIYCRHEYRQPELNPSVHLLNNPLGTTSRSTGTFEPGCGEIVFIACELFYVPLIKGRYQLIQYKVIEFIYFTIFAAI